MPTRPDSPYLSASLLLPLAFGLLTYIVALNAGSKVLGDPDVYLHIAVGRWIITHGYVPHQDIFSHSMPGAPWVPHEWLSEIIFAYVYEYFGWIGLVVLTGLAYSLALGLLARALTSFFPPLYALVGVTIAWTMCLPSLLARPHILVYPLLVGWVIALVFARIRNRTPSPFILLLMVVWANLHGSFIIGLVIAAFFGAEALLEARDRKSALRVVLHWGAFGLFSLLAASATPNGISGLLLPFELVHMEFTLSWIIEWTSPNFQSFSPFELWLLLLLAGALLFRIRLPITRVAMLLFFLHMALQHRRHGPQLGLLAPLLVAPSLAGQLPQRLQGYIYAFLNKRETLAQAFPLSVVLTIVVLFIYAAGATVWRRDLVNDIAFIAPAAALAAAKQNNVTGPVYNEYSFGGFLIFSGVPTFIDGRADMYGDKFVERNAQLEELPQLLDQYKITWTLLPPTHPGKVLLDHLPGWRRIYADTVAVVHVRTNASSP